MKRMVDSRFSDLYDVIIVLGHSNDWKGTLSPIAEQRIAKGIELFEKGNAPFILLTSGRGKEFNVTSKAHAQWAKQELLKRLPLSPNRILTETTSRSTIENALFAKKVIDKKGWERLLVVTSGYHLSRARMIFNKVFAEDKYDIYFVKARLGFRPFFWLEHRLKEMLLKHRNKKELKAILSGGAKRKSNKDHEENF